MRLTIEIGCYGFFLNTRKWYSIAHDCLIPRVLRIKLRNKVWDTQQGWRDITIQSHS
jgi:hypothetical protein